MGHGNAREEAVYVGEDVSESIDAEDVQPGRTFKTPEVPPREEVEEHRVDHRPYRSWCDECTECAGREDAHRNVESHSIALISMDYLFITKKGVYTDKEAGWDDPDAMKVLAVKDTKSKSFFCYAVPQNGIDDKRFAADCTVEDILRLGYAQVLVKSDSEPAIVKLLKESLAALKVEGRDASEEHPPPYDS